ncbi:uncharacterized protein LOC132639231 [Lycium barbarum]|uniref:uncharacterized protein LOC132639231 n=1 Tax=Lycium barbarum TaxID=112863 RepID=UPI00293EFA19|nr:uncharacterized protein LOC132639231 [Lycium barbarum]
MCKQLKLNHLIFADDLMIFYEAEIKSVTRVMEALSLATRVMEALSHFSGASKLVENMEKSNLFMAGIEDEVKSNYCSGQIIHVLKYILYQLMPHVDSASFWGSVFILPQSLVKTVDQKCREYLWGFTEGQRKVSLVSWDQVCRPKKSGGLNVKGCKNWNIKL